MMTLKELKLKMCCPNESVLPTAKVLRLLDPGEIVAKIEFGNGSSMTAYRNGYVLYQVFNHTTVLSAFSGNGYVYEMDDGRHPIDEEFFEKENWYIRFMLEAEDRLEENQKKQQRHISIDDDLEDWEGLSEGKSVEDDFLKQEAIQEIKEALTDRQKEVMFRYYLEGETLEAIGNELGITKQGVKKILQQALDRCRKQLSIDVLEVLAND
jgi:RNA polymerase sigma factor (sigma-70 family)